MPPRVIDDAVRTWDPRASGAVTGDAVNRASPWGAGVAPSAPIFAPFISISAPLRDKFSAQVSVGVRTEQLEMESERERYKDPPAGRVSGGGCVDSSASVLPLLQVSVLVLAVRVVRLA